LNVPTPWLGYDVYKSELKAYDGHYQSLLYGKFILTIPSPTQIKAARALLAWRQSDLAEHSGISEITIKNVERGATDPRVTTMAAIQSAFENAGIEFLENGVVSR